MVQTQYNIVIAGSGKLAKAWFAFFRHHNAVAHIEVLSRSFKLNGFPKDAHLKYSLQHINSKSNLFIIAVSDRAVSKLAKTIYARFPKALVCHCSGTVLLSDLPQPLLHKMVVYPMYSFNGQSQTDWSQVPLFIEGLTTKNKKTIVQDLFANLHIYTCNSNERIRLHCAAVITHNFSNALLVWANSILPPKYQKHKVWYPLLHQWFTDLNSHLPKTLQTGPALRNDKTTIQKHIQLFSTQNFKVLYRKLTQLIQIQHEL